MIHEELLAEMSGFWEMNLSATRLSALTGQRREHLQQGVVKDLRNKFNLQSGRGKNVRIALPDEMDLAGPQTAEEFIACQPGIRILSGKMDKMPVVERTATYTGTRIESRIFRRIYSSMQSKAPLRFLYRSKNGDFHVSFSPHSLVQTARRSHFRGYRHVDGKQGQYMDLVPSRIMDLPVIDPDGDYYGIENDQEWSKRLTLEFRLNRELPENVRSLIVHEYQDRIAYQENDIILTISDVRSAMATYVEEEIRHRIISGAFSIIWERIT